jgi:acyl carrier protein
MTDARFTLTDLKQILIERVGVRPPDVPDDPASRLDDLGVDSLGVTQLYAAIEQRFGCRIPEEDLSTITTTGDLIAYVNERLARQA